jgi:hypothetical protein
MSTVISPSLDQGATGSYIWRFSIVNNTSQTLVMRGGAAPDPITINSGAHGDYFTLYDVGFQQNSAVAAPASFRHVSYNLGSTPGSHAPGDDPSTRNVTFYAVDDTPIASKGRLSGFQIESIYNFQEMSLFSYSVAQQTGIQQTGFMYYGQQEFTDTSTPEPSTYATLGCGLAVLGLVARRRKRKV